MKLPATLANSLDARLTDTRARLIETTAAVNRILVGLLDGGDVTADELAAAKAKIAAAASAEQDYAQALVDALDAMTETTSRDPDCLLDVETVAGDAFAVRLRAEDEADAAAPDWHDEHRLSARQLGVGRFAA